MDETRNLQLNNGLWYFPGDQPQDSDVMTEDEIEAKVEDLRQALKVRREAAGLTTREVACKAGMKSNTNVSYFENRSNFAAIKDLYRLAAVYNVELPDLAEAFRGSNDRTAETVPDRKAMPAEAMKPD